jgi:hypothetical protein
MDATQAEAASLANAIVSDVLAWRPSKRSAQYAVETLPVHPVVVRLMRKLAARYEVLGIDSVITVRRRGHTRSISVKGTMTNTPASRAQIENAVDLIAGEVAQWETGVIYREFEVLEIPVAAIVSPLSDRLGEAYIVYAGHSGAIVMRKV